MFNRYSTLVTMAALGAVLTGCGGGSSSSSPSSGLGSLATNSIVISSVRPTSGTAAGGTTVTITGQGFQPGKDTVYFGQTKAPAPVVASTNSMTVVSPAVTALGFVDVRVVNSAGVSAVVSADQYDYTSPAIQPGATNYTFENSFGGSVSDPNLETLISPTAIAVDASGNIWVADKDTTNQQKVTATTDTYLAARIWRFTPSGTLISMTHFKPTTGSVQNATIGSLATDPYGFVYGTDNQYPTGTTGEGAAAPSIYKFGPNGNTVASLELGTSGVFSSKPIPAGVDAHHNVYVQIDAGSEMMTMPDSLAMLGPTLYPIANPSIAQGAMVMDTNGDAFLANLQVAELTPTGSQDFITSVRSGLQLDGVAVDGLGYSYVSSEHLPYIVKFDQSGNVYVSEIGNSGGAGQLTQPAGVAVSGQDVWVVDTTNLVGTTGIADTGVIFHYGAILNSGTKKTTKTALLKSL